MATTSITASQLQQINSIFESNPNDPGAVWAALASMGDQYAQAAFQGTTSPSTFFAHVIGYSNLISGISQQQMLLVEQSVVQGYLNILNSTPTTNIGTIPLPNTTQIEANYYNSLNDNRLPPSAAIDLAIEKLSPYFPGGGNWYTNFFGLGLNLDENRIGPPSAVIDNISTADATAHFIAAGALSIGQIVAQVGNSTPLNEGEDAVFKASTGMAQVVDSIPSAGSGDLIDPTLKTDVRISDGAVYASLQSQNMPDLAIALQANQNISQLTSGVIIDTFGNNNLNAANGDKIFIQSQYDNLTASGSTLYMGSSARADFDGNNDYSIMQANASDHLGVAGMNEIITGDTGSDHVNLLGDNTSATVSGGGVVGLVGNGQTLTLGDQGETIQTAGGDQYDNVIGSGANIGYAANVRGDVTGNSDTVNLQGNTGDHLGVTGAGEVVTGDSGSDHVNLLGDNTSATVDGGGVVGLVGNGQNLALGNQGDTVQTAAGDQNENISGSGETIGFAANTSGNISGQNDQVGLQSNSGDSVGVSGQGMVVTGDGGNNVVNLAGNGTTATVYGGGYVGLVGNNETLQVATNQDFTIDVAPGQTDDAIYADNSTINLPGGWDGSIYGEGLTVNMDPYSGSHVMLYGYDDTFNGSEGDGVGADAYDPSNPDDPYAPYQDGDPSPGTPYNPEGPDPTDPGDPYDPGDPEDLGEEKLATNGTAATSHPAKLTSSSNDTHASTSNPMPVKTSPMAGGVASSTYPPEVAARAAQLVSAMATFGAPSASDTSSNTTSSASHPSLTVDPSQSGHAVQPVRHAA